jgi:hypothetical protein
VWGLKSFFCFTIILIASPSFHVIRFLQNSEIKITYKFVQMFTYKGSSSSTVLHVIVFWKNIACYLASKMEWSWDFMPNINGIRHKITDRFSRADAIIESDSFPIILKRKSEWYTFVLWEIEHFRVKRWMPGTNYSNYKKRRSLCYIVEEFQV